MLMSVTERFVRLCGEVGNLTKELTGVSVVDAYFGPAHLSPLRQPTNRSGLDLHAELMAVSDAANEELTDTPLRAAYVSSEARSLAGVCEWIDGGTMPYQKVAETLFSLKVHPYPDSLVEWLRATVAEALSAPDDEALYDAVRIFQDEGLIEGAELEEWIGGTLQQRSTEVGRLFDERVFSKMGVRVTDNGVLYETVRGKPWSGYNYYQGNFKSVNQFNIDRRFNRDSIMGIVYHEYEHHVSNLWREKAYRERGFVELSIVPLHTGRCVISEGTADTAKDFLGIKEEDPRALVVDALYALRRVVSINAAFMMNVEGVTREEAASYIAENGLRDLKDASASVDFIAPETPDGRPNFWAPYVFTYYIGRTDFVFPTWKRAVERGEITRFFKTLYLNPFSGSSATWNEAFAWLD